MLSEVGVLVKNLGLVVASGLDTDGLTLISRALNGVSCDRKILFCSWETLSQCIAYDALKEVAKPFNTIYTYVLRIRDLNRLAKTLSRVGVSEIIPVYHVTNYKEVVKTLNTWSWNTSNRIGFFTLVDAELEIKPFIRHQGFKLVERDYVFNLTRELYTDPSEQRFVELLTTSAKPLLRSLYLVYSGGIVEITPGQEERTSLLEKDLMSRLCSAAWSVKLEASIGGEECINPRLITVMKALTTTNTIKGASALTGLSQPTIRSIIRQAESCLGLKLVHVVKGGVERGGAHLTINALRLISFYDELKKALEEELEEALKRLCTGLERE